MVFEFLFFQFLSFFVQKPLTKSDWKVEDTAGRKQGGPSEKQHFKKKKRRRKLALDNLDNNLVVDLKELGLFSAPHCTVYQTTLLPRLWMLLLVLVGRTQKTSVVYSLSANPFTK